MCGSRYSAGSVYISYHGIDTPFGFIFSAAANEIHTSACNLAAANCGIGNVCVYYRFWNKDILMILELTQNIQTPGIGTNLAHSSGAGHIMFPLRLTWGHIGRLQMNWSGSPYCWCREGRNYWQSMAMRWVLRVIARNCRDRYNSYHTMCDLCWDDNHC